MASDVTRVQGGKVISSTNPNVQVGSAFVPEAPGSRANPTGAGAVASGVVPNGEPNISPPTTSTNTPVNTSQPNPATVNATPYTVKAGDTLSGIAQAQGMSTADLLKNNPLITNPNKINTGQSLNLGTQSASQQGFNAAQASGTAAPQDAGSAMGQTKSFMPASNNAQETPPAVQNYFNPATNPSIADQIQQIQDAISPPATRDSLNNAIGKLQSDQTELSSEKLELMNIKNVMAGSEQDIRDEITKAGGFATNSQVLALTTARNQTLLQQETQLTDQLQTQQDTVANDTTLVGQEKDMANTEASQRMGILNFLQTNQTNQQNAARSAIDTLIKTPGGLQAYASSPAQAAYAEQVMGYAPGTIAQLAKASQTTQNLDNAQKQASINASNSTTAKNNADTKKTLNDINTSNSLTNSPSGNIPSSLQPYLNTASDGVTQYIDASTLQGTSSQKTQLINQATAAGLKVITNKNTAADLVNIQDANSKLDTVTTMLQGIDQPGWIQRTLGGLGLTKLEVLSQSDPQKAAAGALSTIGTDILKAMQGTQGSRMSQAAVANINKELPSIYDTQDVVTQKVNILKQLLSDRENAALKTSTGSGASSPSGMVQMTGPQGTFNVPSDKVSIFKQNGYQ